MVRLFIVFLTLSLLSPVSSFAQSETGDSTLSSQERKKLTKEEKKEARWAKREEKELRKSERKLEELQRKQINYTLIKEIVEDSAFVLEGTSLYNRYGRSVPVSPSINFIAISGDSLTLQIGSDFSIGRNGAGGITLEGRILKYEVDENQRIGSISVNINVKSTILGLASVLIKITDSSTFSAQVRGSWRQQLSMSGNFKTWESSQIFKGRVTKSLYEPY